YTFLNGQGRNHFDGSMVNYASVASARDTMTEYPGSNHADYPGAFDLYVNIFRKDLAAGPLNADVILVGCGNTQKPVGAAGYHTIFRTVDGGTTWTCPLDPATSVVDLVLGQTYDWWEPHSAMLGKGD